MKISISGPAAAYEGEYEAEITDSGALKKLDAVKSDDSCVEYLDVSLAEIGLVGGQLEFVYVPEANRLRIRTPYHSPGKLKKKELDRLVEETCGQWSDGIGEGAFDEYAEQTGVRLDPFPTFALRRRRGRAGRVV